jgi:hypothetical protein
MPTNPSPAWRKSVSRTMIKKWRDDPEYREKCVAARRRLIPEWKAHPERFSRRGVPNGMRKAEAMKLWSEAGKLADIAMRGFEAKGLVPQTIPDGDEALAKAALRELCVLALGPCDKRTKIMALGTVLKYTKPKPAQRRASTVTAAEDWLRAAIVAGAANAMAL